MARSSHPAGYQHGLRVRLGSATGPLGKLLHCESKRTGGKYWRVRLDSGEWKWPNEDGGVIVDGPGNAVSTCQQCGLRFVLRQGSGEVICTRCDREMFGTHDERVSDPPPAKRWNDSRRWIRPKPIRGRR